MASIACVVDISALRHWQGLKLAGRPLEDWLWQEFDVQVSEAVLEELKRQKPYWQDRNHFRKIKGLVANSVSPMANADQVERAVFSEFGDDNLIRDEKDKGERHNFCVAVVSVAQCKFTHAIFLTDDLRAINRFVDEGFDTFRAGCVWNSYEFILFIYLKHSADVPVTAAKNLLRDLTANIVRPPMPDTWTQRLTDYTGKLSSLSRTLAQLT